MSPTPTLPALAIEQAPIEALRPDPANPRRISEEELESLTRSLRQWGFVQPVLAPRQDATVIGGHQRLVAARRLGLDRIPVIWLDLSTEQARLLNLALNRISGDWDEQLLARLLADLRADLDLDLTLSGFGEDEISDLLKSLDAREKADQVEVFDLETALEDATRAPRTNPGDLWALGERRLLCGDATDPAAVARLLGEARPRLLATDPPYGVPMIRRGATASTTPWVRPSSPTCSKGDVGPGRATEAPGRARGRSHGRSSGHRNTTLTCRCACGPHHDRLHGPADGLLQPAALVDEPREPGGWPGPASPRSGG